ncbi:MAG: CHASE2 domain-containing protein [Candidatus Omnitrophica bacterium]|nr:CHASE2 domain-containing protein [Candidatus Omnitrophota bacterium]
MKDDLPVMQSSGESFLWGKFGTAVLVVFLMSFLYVNRALEMWELWSVDRRFRARGAEVVSSKVVLVEIAEDSIKEIGRWPWDRRWHAALIRALKAFGARTIAFEPIFSEPSDPASDDALAKVIQDSGNVFFSVKDSQTESRDRGVDAPMPLLAQAAKGLGHIVSPPDRDGTLRRVSPSVRYGGREFWPLGILAGADWLGIRPESIRLEPDRMVIESPERDLIEIPLTQQGDILINWPGSWEEAFRHVSYVDVVTSYARWRKGEAPRISVDLFKDALCIVGVSATGLCDIRTTPVDPVYPRVGLEAVLADCVIQNRFLHPVGRVGNLFILWVFGAVLFVLHYRHNFIQTTGVILVAAAAYYALSLVLFRSAGIVVTVVYPMALTLFMHLALSVFYEVMFALEKQRLVRAATTDGLTGLFNLRHFKALLQREIEQRILKPGTELCVAMADVDSFKEINDEHGHAAGDAILRLMGATLKTVTRGRGAAGRYGGDEFVLMFTGLPLTEAARVLESARAEIAGRRGTLGEGSREPACSASFGVAAFRESDTSDTLLARADEALYLSKRAGRNRVHCL